MWGGGAGWGWKGWRRDIRGRGEREDGGEGGGSVAGDKMVEGGGSRGRGREGSKLEEE